MIVSAWQTPEALTFIRENFAAGKTDKWIADQLGVTKSAVVSKRTRLMGKRDGRAERIETAHRSMQSRPQMSEFHQGDAPKWRSPEGDAIFTAAWRGNVRNDDIAEFFDIDRNTLRLHRIKLKLTPRAEPSPYVGLNGWGTPDGDIEFTRQWMSHVRAEMIRNHFGISDTALKTRRARLDLPLRTGAEVRRRPNKPRTRVEARTPVRPPKPIGAPKIKPDDIAPLIEAKTAAHRAVVFSAIKWSLATLPKSSAHSPGQCRWPLTCEESANGLWCAGHSGLLKGKAA